MQFLEGIIAIVLSTLMLIPIITVSQSIRTLFEKIAAMRTDLALERSLSEIPTQNLADSKVLLSEIIRILSSNRVTWGKIELLSKKNGRIVVDNEQALNNPGEQHTRPIRIIRVSSEDIVYIVVSVGK
ncbi:MAG: hypothetical protein QXI42_06435 [Thermoproteota archaeon]|nr:hypothetical protein [Candidatus Brockarchaeota archaeon]